MLSSPPFGRPSASPQADPFLPCSSVRNADDAAPVCVRNIFAAVQHHHRGSSEGELDHGQVLAVSLLKNSRPMRLIGKKVAIEFCRFKGPCREPPAVLIFRYVMSHVCFLSGRVQDVQEWEMFPRSREMCKRFPTAGQAGYCPNRPETHRFVFGLGDLPSQ